MEPARKFKIIVNSKECGTCSGSSPSAVAKKVIKKLCGTSSKTVQFSLKEYKRGCERVCGPYQGRMEKLDRPYTRSGKKITHRVVCGKVRKMRGGHEFDKNITNKILYIPSDLKHDFDHYDEFKFEKGYSDTDLKYKIIKDTIYLFLGTVTIGGNDYYRYIITKNINRKPSRRMVPISTTQYIDINEIYDKKYNSALSNDYKRIFSELGEQFKKDFDETILSIPLAQREVIAKSIYKNNTGQTTMAPFMRSILKVAYNSNIDNIIKEQWQQQRQQQQQQQQQ